MRRPLLAAATAFCALVSLPAITVAAPTITEFSSGITASSEPRGIAAGPDGALWFTENALGGQLARITTAGSVTEFSAGLTPNGGPWGIAAGSDGNLWLTENALLGSIRRATTLGAVAGFTSGLTPSGELRGIAEGPDGNLWATWSANPGRIVRITPSGTITEFTAGLLNNNTPSGITAGPDGNVWFTESGNPARIGRITPGGVITEFGSDATLTATSAPEDIVTGPDGNLWFAMAGGIGRITPAGTITEFTAGVTPGSRPSGIAAGPDGALWFTETTNPGRIGRITTSGVVTEFTSGLSTNAAPLGITAGPDDAMWFTERLGNRIGRITVGPGVVATEARDITTTQASLSTTVRSNSQLTLIDIEYGTTTAYGRFTLPDIALASSTPHGTARTLTGLAPGTTYHYRVVATNPSGTTVGPDGVFTTVGEPVPAPISPGPADPPAPEAGRTVVTGPASGTVLVRRPGASSFSAIRAAASIPVGSVIDATRGRIAISSAVGTHGATQTATFWGGVFQVRQARAADGFVDLHLRGPAPVCRRPAAGVQRSAATRRPVARSLWGKDSGGRYRTHGRNSVATVRGTIWMTRETCAGTLTRVLDGAVSVRDVRRGRTVLVRAGGKYLARVRR